MNRRDFLKSAGYGTLGAGFIPRNLLWEGPVPKISITIDDMAYHANPLKTWAGMTDGLLNALKKHNLHAAIFVAGRNVDKPEGKQILRFWNDAGHIIANHTYSHRNFHAPEISVDAEMQDIIKGERIIQGYPNFTRLFRFPMLKEGDTVTKRDALRSFLKQRGYRIGHVTIDTSDWYIDQRFREKLARDHHADTTRHRDYYLEHILKCSKYYGDLSQEVTGRFIKHTLLIHHNLLNALFLDDVLTMYKRDGWGLVDARDAFEDPIFASAPQTIPAGESLIWALAKEAGKYDELLRYPSESAEYERKRMDELGL